MSGSSSSNMVVEGVKGENVTFQSSFPLDGEKLTPPNPHLPRMRTNSNASNRRPDDWLVQRIYTVASSNERPHFQLNARRNPKLMPGSQRATASPSRLDPLNNTSAPIAEAAESDHSKVLKAKNPTIVPASSTRSRSSGNRPTTGDSTQLLGVDVRALQSLIHPMKRHFDDRTLDKEIAPFGHSLRGESNVIPPIRNDTIKESNDMASAVNQAPNKREWRMSGCQPILQSKNPFDFIQHMKLKGQEGDFTYLNVVRKNESNYNPYNLEIVDYSNGVTYFTGQAHGDFTPLKQWQREHELFHKLLRIPFFMSYRLWKCFTLWKRHILHTKILRAKAKLTKSLFLVHPTLRSTILKIRASCMDILAHRRLLKVQEGKTYFLTDFLEEQTAWVEKCGSDVLKKWELSIRNQVEAAGIECLKEKGFNIHIEDLEEEKEEDVPGGPSEDIPSTSAPTAKKLSFTEQAARRAECRRLQRFVKLIDYLMVSTLHMLAIDSARDFLRSVFHGCKDVDVVITDIEGGGNLDLNGFPNTEGVSLQATESSKITANSDQKSSVVQVGGIVVGPEVLTSDLILCGFDGFPAILSKIIRKTKFKTQQLTEASDEMQVDDIGRVGAIGFNREKVTQVVVQDKKKEPKPLVPLFSLELLLKDRAEDEHCKLYLSPALFDYMKAVDAILKAFVAAIQKVDLLSNTILYLNPTRLSGGAAYVRGLEESEYDDGPQIISILSDEGYFTEVCGRIRGTLLGMFKNAFEWMHKWDDVRMMWLRNESFSSIKSLETSVGEIAVLLVKMDSLGGNLEGGVAGYLLDALGHTSGEENSEAKKEILQISSTNQSSTRRNCLLASR
ncbi:hypothetical protein BC829DRAFT_433435 [Chytridium lagenaria]|nr:hypothetical protein BC829DRAFT_433435 [Chytridium lagenaria]